MRLSGRVRHHYQVEQHVMKKMTSVGIVILLLGPALSVYAQTDALERLKSYIEVDTTNPPGNETRGVAFFSRIFDEAGISYETAESAPGRGNIWARLEGGDDMPTNTGSED